eukprot:c21170_g1_i3.p1 GENE.c21170_g1_i3~~c21170_g1_i3.p1  ORF type:complete len:120 (+),score=54.30 c21170_g1_i3:197-556(+)
MKLTHESVEKFFNVSHSLEFLGLKNIPCNNSTVELICKNCPKLKEVHFNSSEITDDAVILLANSCNGLTDVVLDQSKLTDAAAQILVSKCPNLSYLDLTGSQVSDAWVQEARQKFVVVK